MYKEMTKITLYGIVRSLGICGFFEIEIEKNERIVDLNEIIMKKYYKSFSDNDFYSIRLWKVKVSFENKVIFDNLKNNKKASTIRIMLNGEEQYGSENIEDTFGNPSKNYYNFVIQGICDLKDNAIISMIVY